MKSDQTDLAAARLAKALTVMLVQNDEEGEKDPELRRFLLYDLNSLLEELGTGARVFAEDMDNPLLLESGLRRSLDLPVQVLQKSPRWEPKLRQWLTQQPPTDPEELGAWASEGEALLHQARLLPSQ